MLKKRASGGPHVVLLFNIFDVDYLILFREFFQQLKDRRSTRLTKLDRLINWDCARSDAILLAKLDRLINWDSADPMHSEIRARTDRTLVGWYRLRTSSGSVQIKA
jgi:hypothetical protein